MKRLCVKVGDDLKKDVGYKLSEDEVVFEESVQIKEILNEGVAEYFVLEGRRRSELGLQVDIDSDDLIDHAEQARQKEQFCCELALLALIQLLFLQVAHACFNQIREQVVLQRIQHSENEQLHILAEHFVLGKHLADGHEQVSKEVVLKVLCWQNLQEVNHSIHDIRVYNLITHFFNGADIVLEYFKSFHHSVEVFVLVVHTFHEILCNFV